MMVIFFECMRGAREQTQGEVPDDDDDTKSRDELRQRERRNGTWTGIQNVAIVRGPLARFLAGRAASRQSVGQQTGSVWCGEPTKGWQSGQHRTRPETESGSGSGSVSVSGLVSQHLRHHGCQLSGVWVSIWRVASQEEWPANNKNRWRRMWPTE